MGEWVSTVTTKKEREKVGLTKKDVFPADILATIQHYIKNCYICKSDAEHDKEKTNQDDPELDGAEETVFSWSSPG